MKIINIVGARPNFMKMAPLMAAYRAYPSIEPYLVHTGQHYDASMSQVFFDDFDLPPPDVNLEIGSLPRLEQIEAIKEAFRPVAAETKPDLILVVGDVNSTVACAEVAKERGIQVAHVEAGLRSFDHAMPEELNRVRTDQLSDYLFVTEPSGMENLEKEGVTGRRFLVGNTMIDTLVRSLSKATASTVLRDSGLNSGSYVACTFHRPSNVDRKEDLERILGALRFMAEHREVVLPLHPRTRESLGRNHLMATAEKLPRVHLLPPLGYVDFLALVQSAACVVTDSGGIQEETTYLQIPCITMRTTTERPITIASGSNQLVGEDIAAFRDAFTRVIQETIDVGKAPDLWDGHAAERIAGHLVG